MVDNTGMNTGFLKAFFMGTAPCILVVQGIQVCFRPVSIYTLTLDASPVNPKMVEN